MIDYCTGCAACYSICPQQCITMTQNKYGFYHPEIDFEKCTNCNVCRTICPEMNRASPPSPSSTPLPPQAFTLINNDEKTRMESSSGGAFSLFAEEVIRQGGVVFGAKFDADFSVVHCYTESIEGISDFRRSKYVQSKIGNSYKECRQFLEQGRIVLFSGTPCQIGGLKAYLRKDYSGLYCQDLICKYIGSPFVWKKYLEQIEKKHNSKLSNIIFRYKDPDWASVYDSFMVFQFNNGDETRILIEKEPFMNTMLRGLNVSLACAQCKYRTLNRLSDITLADFWGINKICPEMFDNRGTSLVLIHSSKGKKLFNQIEPKCRVRKIPAELAVKYNLAAIKHHKHHKHHKHFFQNIDKYRFDALALKYHAYGSLSRRLYKLLRRNLKKSHFITNVYRRLRGSFKTNNDT